MSAALLCIYDSGIHFSRIIFLTKHFLSFSLSFTSSVIMVLHVLRLSPRILLGSCRNASRYTPHITSEFSPAAASLAPESYNVCNITIIRSFSDTSIKNEIDKPNIGTEKKSDTDDDDDDEPLVGTLYEGPFASLTLRLKRISLTSAVVGIVGLPALSLFYGSTASVPPTGQLAVIATAGITAIGSTAILSYCFSPYVHSLERLPSNNNDMTSEYDEKKDKATNSTNNHLVRIITRDLLSRRVETTFDPTIDVYPPPKNNTRPFCNFMVNGLPFYVHPEMVHDQSLRVQLVGEEEPQKEVPKNKLDDDEFF